MNCAPLHRHAIPDGGNRLVEPRCAVDDEELGPSQTPTNRTGFGAAALLGLCAPKDEAVDHRARRVSPSTTHRSRGEMFDVVPNAVCVEVIPRLGLTSEQAEKIGLATRHGAINIHGRSDAIGSHSLAYERTARTHRGQRKYRPGALLPPFFVGTFV